MDESLTRRLKPGQMVNIFCMPKPEAEVKSIPQEVETAAVPPQKANPPFFQSYEDKWEMELFTSNETDAQKDNDITNDTKKSFPPGIGAHYKAKLNFRNDKSITFSTHAYLDKVSLFPVEWSLIERISPSQFQVKNWNFFGVLTYETFYHLQAINLKDESVKNTNIAAGFGVEYKATETITFLSELRIPVNFNSATSVDLINYQGYLIHLWLRKNFDKYYFEPHFSSADYKSGDQSLKVKKISLHLGYAF